MYTELDCRECNEYRTAVLHYPFCHIQDKFHHIYVEMHKLKVMCS